MSSAGSGLRAGGPRLELCGIGFRVGARTILHPASATLEPGTVTAVIGPSGSGKSTLLRCLAGFITPSCGNVLIDGAAGGGDALRGRLGFVPQDDIVHRELRVDDALRFAARLRLAAADDADIRRRVDETLSELGLAERRRLRVRQLSGGQRKRVSIGVELLADPDLLVLDEPASGLDPGTEEDLLAQLRQRAAGGTTVLLTTHSMEYLDRTDAVWVLTEGAMVFTGTLPQLLEHFAVDSAADVFKALRARPREHWQRLASRAGIALEVP